MTDFSKPQNQPDDSAGRPQSQPQGGFPPAPQSQPPGGYPPAPQSQPQGGYPPAPQSQPQGGYPPAPQSQPQGGYGQYGPPPGAPGGYYPPAPQAGYGAVPPGFTVDPGSGLMLPEGVELASHGRRIGAYFLAFALLVVTLFIGYLIWGLVVWGKGTSPALKVLKMKCYKPTDGRVASFGTMALRDIVGGIVQGILSIVTLLVSFIMFLATGKRQTLPDVIAGTVVVYDPNNVLG